MSEICQTCDQCGEDKTLDKDKKVEEFMQEFHEHGIGCGIEISKIAREMHPDAIAIIPLYRSCVVIEQSDEEKKEGVATVHAYSDPHWLGREITTDNLRSDDFHAKFIIQGHREGPEIFLENANNYQKMMKQGIQEQ